MKHTPQGIDVASAIEIHLEVGNDRLPISEEYVCGFDVPVYYSALVGMGQGFRNLPADSDRVLQGEHALPIQPGAEVLPLHKGHDVKEDAVLRSRVENR